jgi:hypothetical protein
LALKLVGCPERVDLSLVHIAVKRPNVDRISNAHDSGMVVGGRDERSNRLQQMP